MIYTIKQIKKELQNAKAIEEALLSMLAEKREYEEADLILITMKIFETCTYIVQLNNLLIKAKERQKKGDEDE